MIVVSLLVCTVCYTRGDFVDDTLKQTTIIVIADPLAHHFIKA